LIGERSRVLISTKCAVCESVGNSKLVYNSTLDEKTFSAEVFSARRLPDRRHYAWVRCKKCKLLRSDPIEDVNLSELYRTSTFDYSSEIAGLKKTYLRILRNARKGLLRENSILEIGGGNGFFLEALVDKGFNKVLGVEPSISAVDKARLDIQPRIITKMIEPNLIPNQSIDVVCVFHVLDHLEDPLSTIETCVATLKPGGTFLIAVHNERSWSARLLGKNSPIFDVEHTYLYSKKTAIALFQRANLVNLEAKAYWNDYSLAYLLHLIPLPREAKNLILNSALGDLLGKIRVTVPLGNIWISGQTQSL
jgi:2-polyprenyl-3-methyl-5-hydroxy-6-metoxy-1,4-benzoquinol methylase